MRTDIVETAAPSAPKQGGRAPFVDWRIALVCVLALVAIPIWRVMSPHAKAGPTTRVLTVAAVRAAREDLFRAITVQAEFRPFQEVDLHAKVAGYLQTMNVDVGDRVEAGQTLGTLEIPELEDELTRARAVESRSAQEVKRAEASYKEIHSAWTRLQATSKAQRGLIADQDLEAAQGREQQASFGLEAAKQQVEIARAETAKLKTMALYSRITAPFAGVITKRYADPGALIQAGISSSTQAMPLVRVSQVDRLRLVFPISMSYVSLVRTGSVVDIQVQNQPGILHGTVSRVTSKIDTATRTMDVEMDVPNPDGKLIPGMYATVAIQLEKKPRALAVPIEAVSRGKSPTVFLIRRDGTLEERAVRLGLETPTRLEIMSGLQENDMLLVGSRSQVISGQKVEPKMLETEKE